MITCIFSDLSVSGCLKFWDKVVLHHQENSPEYYTPRHQVKKFLLFGQPLGFLKKSAQKGWLKIRNRAFRFLENMNQSMFDRLESLLNPVDVVGSFCVSSSGLTS